MSEEVNLPRPSDELEIRPGKTVFMSYGMLMDIQRLLPNPDVALKMVMTDFATQDYLVRRILTAKKGTVFDVEDLIDSEDVDLSPAEISVVLDWAVQHSLHFFATRTADLVRNGRQFQVVLQSHSQSGSQG